MTDEHPDRHLGIVTPGIRASLRNQKIKAVEASLQREYAIRIRAAMTKDEKRVLTAERDAEIKRQIDPLIQAQKLDTPECL